jgi:hypothetical protein
MKTGYGLLCRMDGQQAMGAARAVSSGELGSGILPVVGFVRLAAAL